MEKSLKELKDEAVSLGVDIKGLKSKVEVSDAIEAYFDSSAKADIVKEIVVDEVSAEPKELSFRDKMNLLAKANEKAARATKIVTVTNNDKRENHVATTAYLSCENQYFGLSKIVPLDEKIELERCLIDIAKDIKIVLHVDEIFDGKRTGNKIPKLINKYVVSFEE